MASAYILINGTGSRHNRQVREFVDRLVAVREDAARLKMVFDQAALGGDWNALAALLDIGSAADAETLYNLLGSVRVELDGVFITQMVGRLG